jgi:hypothetical protein
MDDAGFRPPNGEKWARETIREMLKNVHYLGKIRFNNRQTITVVENGERVQKMIKSPADEIIISEGKHDGIVSPELFDAAANRLKNNPRTWTEENDLVNVLAGVLICSKCKRVMIVRSSKIARTRYMCPHKPQCFKSAIADDVVEAVITALETVELPALEEKLRNGEGDAAVIQKRRIAELRKQMQEYREMEDEQYELLERKKYTQEVFDRRNASLRAKMDKCEKDLFQAEASMPKNVDYAEKVASLKKAIASLRNPNMSNKDKNKNLREIVEHIKYTAAPTGSKENKTKLKPKLRL